jgi:hypothetical protein
MKLDSIASIAIFSLIAISIPTAITAQSQPYGTSRMPQSCPSKSVPKVGAISAKQAEKYFTCHVERGDTFTGAPATYLTLVTDLKIQVASKSRRATMADINRAGTLGTPIGVNESKPVYDIKGSYKSHHCSRYADVVATKTNCTLSVYKGSQGICFQDSFNEWNCLLTGRPVTSLRQAPPQ